MPQTHDLAFEGNRVTKRYTSWDRDEHLREWTVLQRVHKHQPDLVPEPFSADLTATPPVVTMSLVPGDPLSGTLTPAQLTALATSLRTLWSVPHDALPPRRHHPGEIVTILTERMGALELTGLPGEAARAARAFLTSYQVVPPATVVLGHTDPNLSNYLWDGTDVRIIDFEDAGFSDPEFELADLVEHISSRDTDWTAFLASFSLDLDRLHAARCLYASFWLHMFRPGGPGERRNPPGTLDRQAHRLLTLLSTAP